MIKFQRFLRSLLGLATGTWVASLLILLPLDLFTNMDADSKTILSPEFLDYYGYKSWSIYVVKEASDFIVLVLALIVLACVLGFTAHAILYRLHWRRLYTYIRAGAWMAFGLSALIAIYFANIGKGIPTAVCFGFFLIVLILSELFTLVISTIFWLIRRPDRDDMSASKRV